MLEPTSLSFMDVNRIIFGFFLLVLMAAKVVVSYRNSVFLNRLLQNAEIDRIQRQDAVTEMQRVAAVLAVKTQAAVEASDKQLHAAITRNYDKIEENTKITQSAAAATDELMATASSVGQEVADTGKKILDSVQTRTDELMTEMDSKKTTKKK